MEKAYQPTMVASCYLHCQFDNYALVPVDVYDCPGMYVIQLLKIPIDITMSEIELLKLLLPFLFGYPDIVCQRMHLMLSPNTGLAQKSVDKILPLIIYPETLNSLLSN
jgi:hypothetical protein